MAMATYIRAGLPEVATALSALTGEAHPLAEARGVREALARRRLGDGADLRVADLGRPLPFPDGAFDDVIASLVLHFR
jgi:SAM-dependent methyltransferase